MNEQPTLTVLICTFNRHLLLGQALESLLRHSTEPPDQVVIVNGGDELADRVVAEARSATAVEVVLVKTRNKNLAASRNIGLPHCRGEIVAMTDDDAMVFPDWVSRMKAVHRDHPEAGAVGGMVIGENPERLLVKVADAMTFPRWSEERYVRTLPGVNISYKAEALRRVGSQDEALFRGEDVDFNWRLQSHGYRILYSPGIRVYHQHRPTLKGLLNQQYMYGRAYVLVRRKHPDMYSILPGPGWTFKDLAKGVRFFAAAIYEPVFTVFRLDGPGRVRALPFITGLELAWRCGMIREYFRRAGAMDNLEKQ